MAIGTVIFDVGGVVASRFVALDRFDLEAGS
jgi:hypothetical protein